MWLRGWPLRRFQERRGENRLTSGWWIADVDDGDVVVGGGGDDKGGGDGGDGGAEMVVVVMVMVVLVVRIMASLRISGETWREQTRFRLVD